LLITLIAVAIAAGLLAGAWLVLRPSGPALTEAKISLSAITPNADGDQDVTRLTYTLRRPASLSIYFLNAQGQRFDFRRDRPRASGQHQVDFSGIVAPFLLPGESLSGELLARVLPDGDYTWVVEAQDANGASSKVTGALTIAEADVTLPELLNFTVSPNVFTPNQDGLGDRTNINAYLSKDVAEGGLRVVLIGPDAVELPIAEKVTDIKPGQRGLHQYDYDGGIDQGKNPPPDGLYTVRAEVEDRLGQKIAVTNTLTIQDGGLPRADIFNGEVEWSATTLRIGQTLYFTLTVENYGTAPIRTSGPPPGTVYTSMQANANTLGEYVQSGAWRVGIHCETCISDYPWRWALGTSDNLTMILDEEGQPQYYLMPGQRATVTGGVVLDQIVESRNPQYFWAGLIHEDVEISPVNNRVKPNFVRLEKP
ncbi:MAG: hypothetical protein ACRDH2_09015, partial [Anaerolineales bacterium]